MPISLKVPPVGSINSDKGLNPLGVPCEMLLLTPGDAAQLSGQAVVASSLDSTPAMPEAVGNPQIVFVNSPPDQSQPMEVDQEGGEHFLFGDSSGAQIQLTYVDNSLRVTEDTEFSITVEDGDADLKEV